MRLFADRCLLSILRNNCLESIPVDHTCSVRCIFKNDIPQKNYNHGHIAYYSVSVLPACQMDAYSGISSQQKPGSRIHGSHLCSGSDRHFVNETVCTGNLPDIAEKHKQCICLGCDSNRILLIRLCHRHIYQPVAIEFMPLLLCIMFIMFCTIYYYENEKRIKLEKKEQIIQIVLEQQLKETEAIKRREKESRILRHDMRLILNNLSLCVNNGDLEAAKKMLADYIAVIDKKDVRHFCSNAMINYILSDFEKRCQEKQIKFIHTVELDDALDIDEVSFLSILSNAMDNAVNAQGELPATNRCIRLILKNEKNKLLLSVKNPYFRKPTIIDGLPVSSKPNHGYGTQSIRYMTEQMGGKCQFILEEQQFVLRVVI